MSLKYFPELSEYGRIAMSLHSSIGVELQFVFDWAYANPEIAAPIAVFIASYMLYGALGKRHLGADDDYWERIRRSVIPILAKFATAAGGYVHTTTSEAEFAGYIQMTEDEFERKLESAGYLRQPIASLHSNERGWVEDGSWARPRGMLFPMERILDYLSSGLLKIPYLGEYTRRFVRSLNTIFAFRQPHCIFYTVDAPVGTRIYVYCHKEFNPLNPITAFLHYRGVGFAPAPQTITQHLKDVGVELQTEN